jgi:hypothetical protein
MLPVKFVVAILTLPILTTADEVIRAVVDILAVEPGTPSTNVLIVAPSRTIAT